jgi:hypothetical protein
MITGDGKLVVARDKSSIATTDTIQDASGTHRPLF